VIIADGLLQTVQFAFGSRDALPAEAAWCGALAYSMQLYFDFSGYSDMSVGLARMFGVRFPANEIKSNVVFGKFGLIRRQAVAEPVCCRSPVVRL
jgi:D-alanyl-lipoteichoic acid acyltransferase DltB (MBOAT superfamily)